MKLLKWTKWQILSMKVMEGLSKTKIDTSDYLKSVVFVHQIVSNKIKDTQ